MDDINANWQYWEASTPSKWMILPYKPRFCCPHCGKHDWTTTSGFQTPNDKRLWVGESLCVPCGVQTRWLIDPDATMEAQTELMHRPLGDENPPKPNACDYKLFDIKTPEGFEKHDISDLIAPTTPNIWADKVDEKDVIDFFNKLAEQKKKRDKEKRSDDDDWTDNLPNQSDYDN